MGSHRSDTDERSFFQGIGCAPTGEAVLAGLMQAAEATATGARADVLSAMTKVAASEAAIAPQ